MPRLSRAGMYLMSAFVATLGLIMWVWWPLVRDYVALFDPQRPLWSQIDWLLIGIFAAMSILIMAGADLRSDVWIVGVGLAGGLAIEGWGTQTHIWNYFTLERPPLWIIPAWPIASLSIDRLVRLLARLLPRERGRNFAIAHSVLFAGFYALMLQFVWPTRGMSLTQAALVICALIAFTMRDRRTAVLTFAAGAGLGYFLELWGTTRACWTYYTLGTPPLFAVLAHGMAAVIFWRAGELARQLLARVRLPAPLRARTSPLKPELLRDAPLRTQTI
ncbi:MAG: hypothetical protein NTY23_06110 [Chloroflexi bacterium]|nr:hypothetical protein [Chloroflexota bacterium]